jgi:hypothetical protein
MPELPRELGALRDRALQALFALKHLEPRLAQRVPERAERVGVEGRRGKRPPALAEVARGGRPPQLVAESTQLLEQLVSRQEAPRKQPGRALGGVPGPEVLDHGLWMDACLRVLRELAHGRRSPQALGGLAELLEDLLVAVAAAQPRSECGELRLVDARPRTPRIAWTRHLQEP